jgi:hypothetical protein
MSRDKKGDFHHGTTRQAGLFRAWRGGGVPRPPPAPYRRAGLPQGAEKNLGMVQTHQIPV